MKAAKQSYAFAMAGLCLVAMMVLTVGCSSVWRQSLYSNRSPEGKADKRLKSGNGYAMWLDTASDRARVFLVDSVAVRAEVANTAGLLILTGPILPILPAFLITWAIPHELKSDPLVVKLEVVPNGKNVQMSFHEISVVIPSGVTAGEPVTISPHYGKGQVTRLGEDDAVFDMQTDSVFTVPQADLSPGGRLLRYRNRFHAELRFHTGASGLQAFDLRIEGLVIDGVEAPPVVATFADSKAWVWEHMPINN